MTKKKSNIKTKFSSAILTTLAVLLISIVGVYFAIKNLNYGLDLQGGFEVLYEVDSIDGSKVTTDMVNSTHISNILSSEETVDEKYFLSDKALEYILSTGTKNFYYKPEIDLEIARPLTSTMHKSHRASQDNYVSDSFVKDGIKTHIPIKEATKKGYKEAHDGDYVNLQFPNSKTRRGRVGDQIANTLLCNDENGVVCGLRIRKLTPKECFRLMGFDDKDCDVLVANRISNTQLYKMAGNSIVVDVLEEIFVELLNQYEDAFPLEGIDNA